MSSLDEPIDERAPHVEPILLTPEAAAAALSVGRTRVYDLLASGALRSVTIGASRRIPLEALQRFVESLQAEQAGSLGSGSVRRRRAGSCCEPLATAARQRKIRTGRDAASTFDG